MPFQELFDALCRNDLAVTTSTMNINQASRSSSDGFCTLVTDVQGGAVKSTSLKLCLSNILDLSQNSGADATTRTLETIGDVDVAVLMSWIQQCPTLRGVQLRCRGAVVHDSRNNHVQAIVQRILKAMAQNPSIQTLTLFLNTGVSWPSLTEYLTSPNGQWLRSLRIESVPNGTDTAAVLDAAAQAIGALPVLEILALRAGGSLRVEQFLPHLIGHHATLQELEINFMCQRLDESLVRVVETCPRLKKVVLLGFNAKTHHWSSVSAALPSNPSITQLQLGLCSFSQLATILFFRDWSSIDASRQHVRHLTLWNCAFAHLPRDELRHIMCDGSLLEHLSLDGYTLQRMTHVNDDGSFFFDTMIVNTDTIPLVSLHLKNITSRTLRHASRYLAVAARLRSLTITMKQPVEHESLNAFVTNLRCNASVHRVKFQVQSSTKLATKQTRRLVKAIAKRNRLLPRIMGTLKVSDLLARDDPQSSCLEQQQQPLRATLLQLPTLCVASIQTPPSSPTNVLKGLLAASSSSSSNDMLYGTASTPKRNRPTA